MTLMSTYVLSCILSYFKTPHWKIEFKLDYGIGDISCHPLDLVNDKDPSVCGKNIACKNIKPISNGVHRNHTCTFLRSLIRVMHRLKYTGYLGCFCNFV